MGRCIGITSGKGGVGKSSVCIGIGFALAKRGYKVCLFDMDLGLKNLDVMMGLENRMFYDVLENKIYTKKEQTWDKKELIELLKENSDEKYKFQVYVLTDKVTNYDNLFADYPIDGEKYILTTDFIMSIAGTEFTMKILAKYIFIAGLIFSLFAILVLFNFLGLSITDNKKDCKFRKNLQSFFISYVRNPK